MATNKTELTIRMLGGVTGQVASTEVDPATGHPLVYQNSAGVQTLRLYAVQGGAWNELTCIAAERQMLLAGQDTLSGTNTLAGHSSMLATIWPALTSSVVTAAVTAASSLIGTKITLNNALPVLATIVATADPALAPVAALFPTVAALIEKMFGIKA